MLNQPCRRDGDAQMFSRLLIANRGEIAIRIARTAADMGVGCVAVYSEDDGASAHVRFADEAVGLTGRGAAAYLDIEAVIAAARATGCEAVHPGYGFLAENAVFARRCAEAGLTFVGPRAEVIELFGDKTRARALAEQCGVPILQGAAGAITLDAARAFLQAHGPIMIKAVAGGGGRGMRAVEREADLAEAYARCQSEAGRSFGDEAVYVERFIPRARHIEVQILGDGVAVSHLWERDCTLQRQNQKLVEIAPSPNLEPALRDQLTDAACRMAAACGYDNIGTFEFLLDGAGYAFIEANPRIQVEHTVTEEVTGLDLVRLQLELAAGRSLADLGLRQDQVPQPRGHAIQLRVNMESMDAEGRSRPSGGTLSVFAPAAGPGIRVDTFGYKGYRTVASFDSLLAKLIVSSAGGDYETAVARARRALREFRIEGVVTNLPFLAALLDRPEVAANAVHTRFIEAHIGELLAAMPEQVPATVIDDGGDSGLTPLRVELNGVVTAIDVAVGDRVARGAAVGVIEAMKMEHLILADRSGVVRALNVTVGSTVEAGAPVLLIEERDVGEGAVATAAEQDLDHVRPDLALVQERVALTLDEARPDAVAKRHKIGRRTARENIADLCDDGSFIEYGGLGVAYQYTRRTAEELRAKSPADGFVMGLATVNGEHFGPERGRVAVSSYEYMVFAGGQGRIGHKKIDRLLDIAAERKLPFILFAEGAGGRPGEDPIGVAGLDITTFGHFARLSGQVPVVGIVSGRCFAGNAALLGCADVIIATEDSTVGMGGPALIEAAGLGTFKPEDVGPIDVQSRNGVVDIRVADDGAAVDAARRYLSYFQGLIADWETHDQRKLRFVIPENRLRAYDVRDVIELLADKDSMLELRGEFGRTMITALIRIEGRPMGVMANNPLHMAGAIDSDGADKAARFLRLCNAHGLPIVSLVDTPGIMIGPEAEKTALVRHAARLFMAGADLRVPVYAVVLRKSYGLGAMATVGGHFHLPVFTVSWPTGEFGGMQFEGGVRLGFKNELEAIAEPVERQAWFDGKVAGMYERGRAVNVAAYFEIDGVIDPADTRSWIVRARTDHIEPPRAGGSIDTW
jgi:acetyl/propionyl-CoA carboxylase alpha subunit/acetyl-CoA carboxylase carboxyltransferase component